MQTATDIYDIAVIGGGINGCGIARDAAGRGLKVLLVEQNDLASGTSSKSTKLIHGGLRYLEHFEFSLVRESLIEREIIWANAPHIVSPLRFVLPHNSAMRPAFLIRLGLFLYDHIGGRKKLPASKSIDLSRDAAGAPLKFEFKRAFEYSDCWVDDARLVVLNAVDAAARGAHVFTRTKLVAARESGDLWTLELQASDGQGHRGEAKARVLVNAAGPWVGNVTDNGLGRHGAAGVKLVKGSHIVVPKMFAHNRAYIFQNPDERIIFAIPYEQDFTLIGTTDVDHDGPPGPVMISPAETQYLCDATSRYFETPVRPDDVIWSYAGLRPLYDEGDMSAKERSRDYKLTLDAAPGRPALLSVYGGKITTYRHLAEDALQRLERLLPNAAAPWTRSAPLPGGDFPPDDVPKLVGNLMAQCVGLDEGLALRLVRAYGTLAHEAIGRASSMRALGEEFGGGLYEREVEYLVAHEWAACADDILWRRNKLGLRLSAAQQARLETWVGDYLAAAIGTTHS